MSMVHFITELLYILISSIIIKIHDTIDNSTRGKFDDPVCDSADKLMVMGGE